jgi:hypothetical protein
MFLQEKLCGHPISVSIEECGDIFLPIAYANRNTWWYILFKIILMVLFILSEFRRLTQRAWQADVRSGIFSCNYNHLWNFISLKPSESDSWIRLIYTGGESRMFLTFQTGLSKNCMWVGARESTSRLRSAAGNFQAAHQSPRDVTDRTAICWKGAEAYILPRSCSYHAMSPFYMT